MRHLIDKLKALLKEYWNLWGSIIISTIWAWWKDFNIATMDTTTSYLTMTLMFLGIFTFFKSWLKSQKKKMSEAKGKTVIDNTYEYRKVDDKELIGEKLLKSQKPIKSINLALDPTSQGRQIGELVVRTMEGGETIMKKFCEKAGLFFKWLWGNKFTLLDTAIVLFIATASQIATYTEYLYKFEWCLQNAQLIKIISPICAVIFVVVDLFCTYTKYGCESNEELKARQEAKVQAKLAQLTPEQKKAVKQKLGVLESALKKAQNELDNAKKVISNFETLNSITGYSVTTDEAESYNQAKNSLVSLSANVDNLTSQIANLKESL